jgi:hypothetical protein
MTEHEERLCPRCGHPAGSHRFCPSCGLNIGSLSQVPPRAEQEPGGVSDEIAREPREAQWSGPASAVEADGVGDQIAGGRFAAPASEIDPDRPPTEDTSAALVAVAPEAIDVPARAEQEPSGVSDEIAKQPREARWSGPASAVESDRVGDQIAGERSTAPASETDPDRTPAEDTTAELVAAPPEAIEVPARAEQERSDVSDETAREPHAEVVAAPSEAIEVPARVAQEPGGVSDEIPREPREARWSGPASAVESNGIGDQIPSETLAAPAPEIDPDRIPAKDTTAVLVAAPPEAIEVPMHADALPGAQYDGWRSVVHLWIARRSRSQRVALVCLVAAIGLVVLQTGRDLRR